MSKQFDPATFIETEYYRILKEQKPIYRITDGEHVFTVSLMEPWRIVRTRFGERICIPIVHDGNEYVIMINRESRFYRSLITTIYEYRRTDPDANGVKVRVVRETVRGRPSYTVSLVEDKEDAETKRNVKDRK